MWWSGISNDIKCYIENCCICVQNSTQKVEPMLYSATPDYPWQKVGCDLFKWKSKTYLLLIDYFSRFIEVSYLSDGSKAHDVVMHMQSIFARHGIPQFLILDNGPPFNSFVFAQFAKMYGFKHVTSSPYFPQGNGEAERGVQIVKRLLRSTDPYLALLSYRSTPLKSGFSPAKLLMGRKIRTTLPMLPKQLDPKWGYLSQFRKADIANKKRQKT